MHIKEEAEHAALIARSAALKRKHALELEQMQMKAKLEQLNIDTASGESSAKLKVLEEHDNAKERASSYTSKKSFSK